MSINKEIIEKAFDSNMTNINIADVTNAVEDTLVSLNDGKLRVAEYINGDWVVHQWIKKAILVSFKIRSNSIIETSYTKFYDKLNFSIIEISSN